MAIEIAHVSGSGSVEASESVFGQSYNEALIHQAVVRSLAGLRAGSKAQKSRSEVRGGGAKPWRQKGTGRARAGTIRSPIWRSGGRAFAAKPRDFSQKLNRKMYRGAMCSILSELVRQQRLKITDDFQMAAPKTKDLAQQLKQFQCDQVLLVLAEPDENVELSARNIPHLAVGLAEDLDAVELVGFDTVLVTKSALPRLEDRFE